jgi:hypothetical protein
MGRHFLSTVVIALATVALEQSPNAAPQQPDNITAPDAYAIYAGLIPQAWATRSSEILLLQQETENLDPGLPCFSSPLTNTDPDWLAVESNFKQQNARVSVLQPMLPIDVRYRLVPRAEILADDARLAVKYPGIWQRLPESMEYAAVSAVGFNPARTKAMVYVRLRNSGEVYFRELQDGKWVASGRSGCGWVA